MADITNYDVILVGASPSNLTLALRLLDLAKAAGRPLRMAVLEKARELGQFSISGAVSNPRVLDQLFPDWRAREGFPHDGEVSRSGVMLLGKKNAMELPRPFMPPGFRKEGYALLTLSHLVRYMGEQLEARAKEVPGAEVDIFPGFAVQAPWYNDSGAGVRGVKVADTGDPESDYIEAKITAFGEKGFVSRDIFKRFGLRRNPQVYAVGVKETWKIKQDLEGQVWHTLGWPVLDGTLGGGFVYGLKGNRLTFGLIISLGSPNPNLYPHRLLQEFKKHPWLQGLLKDGELIKYGASNLPEGGWYSLPEKFALDGCLFLGDSLGVLDQMRLSGVDKAMQTGWIAADVIHDALGKGDCSEAALACYKTKVMESFVGEELYSGRNFRSAWDAYPELLRDYLPKLCLDVIDRNPKAGIGSLMAFGLGQTLASPSLPFKALTVKRWMEGHGPVTAVYHKDWQYIDPTFSAPARSGIEEYDRKTVQTLADAVFSAQTHYEAGEHIDEFDAGTCLRCVGEYHGKGKEVPCVADCTAEVHRLDDKSENGKSWKVHAMSFENCVQCRTCEIVCPKENLRVNAAPEGSGPNFMGL